MLFSVSITGVKKLYFIQATNALLLVLSFNRFSLCNQALLTLLKTNIWSMVLGIDARNAPF